ncbi:MAG: hypothetical protein KC777_17040 [Cyanobacteria bacterium HKST-UBA02]|nr:hypothetical protein [Cyanobacteria bacterium HKST-UBA02]
MRNRENFDLTVNGFWLGSAQVGLVFHLIYSQGAGVLFYFALIALWLLGSIAGMKLVNNRYLAMKLEVAALIFFGLAALVTRSAPFTPWSLACVLLAVILISGYAGWFLKSRATAYGDVSRVLLFENNGFVLGYAVAGALLFYSIKAIDILTAFVMTVCIIFEFICPIVISRGSDNPDRGQPGS